MQNVTITISGNVATITVDLAKRLGPSSTGKTILVASTGGAIPIPGHESVKLNVTAFVKA